MNKIVKFIQESYFELKKVSWPSREQVINYTIAVIVISIALALFLGFLDMLFAKIIEWFVL